MNRWRFILMVFATISVSCSTNEGSVFIYKKPSQTHLTFKNNISSTDELNILDYLYFYNGGGTAVGDINNDGLPDIYLTANQLENKLYLNKGNFKFEDITKTAGVAGNNSWDTGTVMVDINNDGFLDIYTCAVVGINGFEGHNQLFINNKDNTFTEKSATYGLDFDTFSSNAAFFDYDLDGDLDMYLLNHAVHTPNSFGKAELRKKRNDETGDRLMRNDGNSFTDVSEEAGIYGGVNSYGLGLTIADFNKDGYPDIYVGNDFHEDDYFYLNQGDGTFKESLRSYFGHITRFSMGSDAADINNDGWPDLMSLDMLPEDQKVIKSTEGDDNFQTLKLRTERFGYYYQFTRNMLYINQQKKPFVETALLSGVAATDWSWSVLIEDYNQDGNQDIFISNGIPKRPNDLDFIKFVSSSQIKNKINQTKLVDQEAFGLMPSGKVHNYLFEGKPPLKFKDQSGKWIIEDTLVSGATAFGDFDNDGDLDIVINNINHHASVLENQTDDQANFLKIKLSYQKENLFGIGTKVYSYHNNETLQFKELFPFRGFQSSSEPLIHFGYGSSTAVDSIRVVWPNGTSQVLKNIATNQSLTVDYKESNTQYIFDNQEQKSIFYNVTDSLRIDYKHLEDAFIDFRRQPLIPYKVSESGPAVAVGDLNADGKDDLFFGSSKYATSEIYLQTKEGFELQKNNFKKDHIFEDVSAVIADFDNDQKNDLFVATGGADFSNARPELSDRILYGKSMFEGSSSIKELYDNASITIANDVDNDGDIDLFVGNHVVTNRFGETPNSYILYNEGGTFSRKNAQQLTLGMVTNAIWSDFNSDGLPDLIVVGEWMSPVFLKNDGKSFIETNSLNENLHGLWQSIIALDVDQDGDEDYLLGNWGTNTKFNASEEHPLRMYYKDFDANGSYETIVSTEYKGTYYPVATLDELSSQMPFLKKKYPTYKKFAGQTIEDIFTKKALDKSSLLEVHTLKSGVLKNESGTFTFVPFPDKLQVAPIKAFVKFDFDGDDKEEVLAAGNFFGVAPYHGRFDAFSGAIIKNTHDIVMANQLGLDIDLKSVRHLNIIYINGEPYLLVTFNHEKPQLYEIRN